MQLQVIAQIVIAFNCTCNFIIGTITGVIVPTTVYGAGAWGMRSPERRKVKFNVLGMKCLISLVGELRMDI